MACDRLGPIWKCQGQTNGWRQGEQTQWSRLSASCPPSLALTANISQLACYVENFQALQTCKSQLCLSRGTELLLSYYIALSLYLQKGRVTFLPVINLVYPTTAKFNFKYKKWKCTNNEGPFIRAKHIQAQPSDQKVFYWLFLNHRLRDTASSTPPWDAHWLLWCIHEKQTEHRKSECKLDIAEQIEWCLSQDLWFVQCRVFVEYCQEFRSRF